jgi:hypothetical protein
VKRNMRKEVKILGFFLVMLLVFTPLGSANLTTLAHARSQQILKTQNHCASDTTPIICQIGDQRVVTRMPVETIRSIIALGESEKDAFLTIYNKYATPEEVDAAFEEIQPFFDALVTSGLTDRSVDDLNAMFRNIREIIKKPKNDPFGPQTLGGWNGFPTFGVVNAVCGIFCMDVPAVGFALGTHTILPTIGLDAFVTWAGDGETISIGGLGYTTSTGPEFGLIFGFIGVMIATPIMILGGLFMTGFGGFYLGVGPAPF